MRIVATEEIHDLSLDGLTRAGIREPPGDLDAKIEFKVNLKRFQTGREIMRTYIPNYVPPTQSLEDQQRLGMELGSEVAQAVLQRISHKKLCTKSKRQGA